LNKLRPYQKEIIDSARNELRQGKNRILCQLATGGGKTYIFCSIIKSAIDRGSKVLILTDRIELLYQAGGSLDSFGLLPENIEAGLYPELSGNLYVGMIETICRRLSEPEYKTFIKNLDLVIIDEAHIRSFTKIFKYLNEKTTVLGFTATPQRDGRTKHLSKEYEIIVKGVSINYLIENEYLSKPHYFGVEVDLSNIKKRGGDYDQKEVGESFSEQKLYIGVVENYEKLTPGKKSIVFSSSISSSEEICKEFQLKGYDVRHLDSTFTETERKYVLKWFHDSKDGILCNVGILTRGFDQPDIETVILYRATKSLPLYLQMVGRGSRSTLRKKDFYILDFGNNIQEHGFWHKERNWTLNMSKKNKPKEDAAPIKECPNCSAILPVSLRFCTECGFEFVKSQEEKEFALLQEMSYNEIKSEIYSGASFERIESIREAKGFKQGWAWRQIPIEKLEDYAKYKRYSSGWVFHQKKQRQDG